MIESQIYHLLLLDNLHTDGFLANHFFNITKKHWDFELIETHAYEHLV
jgi:hypothetical protein